MKSPDSKEPFTVGGTVSEISGGKFANGAVTAAMVHLLNHKNILHWAR